MRNMLSLIILISLLLAINAQVYMNALNEGGCSDKCCKEEDTECNVEFFVQYSPCAYSCSVNGVYHSYNEDDFSKCGTNKVCYNGQCRVISDVDTCQKLYGDTFVGLEDPFNTCQYQCISTEQNCERIYLENVKSKTFCVSGFSNSLGVCEAGVCILPYPVSSINRRPPIAFESAFGNVVGTTRNAAAGRGYVSHTEIAMKGNNIGSDSTSGSDYSRDIDTDSGSEKEDAYDYDGDYYYDDDTGDYLKEPDNYYPFEFRKRNSKASSIGTKDGLSRSASSSSAGSVVGNSGVSSVGDSAESASSSSARSLVSNSDIPTAGDSARSSASSSARSVVVNSGVPTAGDSARSAASNSANSAASSSRNFKNRLNSYRSAKYRLGLNVMGDPSKDDSMINIDALPDNSGEKGSSTYKDNVNLKGDDDLINSLSDDDDSNSNLSNDAIDEDNDKIDLLNKPEKLLRRVMVGSENIVDIARLNIGKNSNPTGKFIPTSVGSTGFSRIHSSARSHTNTNSQEESSATAAQARSNAQSAAASKAEVGSSSSSSAMSSSSSLLGRVRDSANSAVKALSNPGSSTMRDSTRGEANAASSSAASSTTSMLGKVGDTVDSEVSAISNASSGSKIIL